tara:strand:- start:404 stop:598 length:195 start_codon:yes stop_codon:yes gene_type:complete
MGNVLRPIKFSRKKNHPNCAMNSRQRIEERNEQANSAAIAVNKLPNEALVRGHDNAEKYESSEY